MNRFFLDPQQPLSTCSSEICSNCPLQSRLHCHFYGRDLAKFLAFAFPPFIIGGFGIAHLNAWLLVPWLGIIFSYFLLVEIRVMCSHCPHYAEPGTKTLKCWANYGAPKLWKYRPGTMSKTEKFIFFGGFVLIFGYPLFFLLAGLQWLLLAIFLGTTVLAATLLLTKLCTQCMNFACPLNQVEPEVKTMFFAHNPEIKKAWKESSSPQ